MIVKVIKRVDGVTMTIWYDNITHARSYFDKNVCCEILDCCKKDGEEITILCDVESVYLCNDNGQTLERLRCAKVPQGGNASSTTEKNKK